MRFCYADPPYPGRQTKKHYPTNDVNHRLLIAHLREFDGWALSTSAPALHLVLPLCPPDARVGAWVKPFASFKPGVNPGYTWEPVIWSGGRPFERAQPTVRDYHAESIAMLAGFPGAKPEGFCRWIFRLLNMRPGDEFVDLFPGSGAVGLAWERWSAQPELGLTDGYVAAAGALESDAEVDQMLLHSIGELVGLGPVDPDEVE